VDECNNQRLGQAMASGLTIVQALRPSTRGSGSSPATHTLPPRFRRHPLPAEAVPPTSSSRRLAGMAAASQLFQFLPPICCSSTPGCRRLPSRQRHRNPLIRCGCDGGQRALFSRANPGAADEGPAGRSSSSWAIPACDRAPKSSPVASRFRRIRAAHPLAMAGYWNWKAAKVRCWPKPEAGLARIYQLALIAEPTARAALRNAGWCCLVHR